MCDLIRVPFSADTEMVPQVPGQHVVEYRPAYPPSYLEPLTFVGLAEYEAIATEGNSGYGDLVSVAWNQASPFVSLTWRFLGGSDGDDVFVSGVLLFQRCCKPEIQQPE